MKNYVVNIFGRTPYSQSKPHRDEKLERETAEDYEARTWRSRLHVNSAGQIYIPAMAFKNCLAEAAKYLSMKVPGKGQATYTKSFEAGIQVIESPVIYGKDGEPLLAKNCVSGDKTKDEPEDKATRPQIFGNWIFTPSDGVPGGGKRVYRCYPVIDDPWSCQVVITVADELITEDVLQMHLVTAGALIGIGRFRIRNRGTYGRFVPEIVEVKDFLVYGGKA